MLINALSHFATLAIVTPFALLAFDVLSTDRRKREAREAREARPGAHEQREAPSA